MDKWILTLNNSLETEMRAESGARTNVWPRTPPQDNFKLLAIIQAGNIRDVFINKREK